MLPQEDRSKPPADWLDRLHEAGHWERLIDVATESLAADPNDTATHRHLAWAYARTNRHSKMKGHVEFLLHAEPEEPKNHQLAAVLHLDTNRHKAAQRHVELLLRKEPGNASSHYLACIYALRCGRIEDARRHIREARSLSPSWPAAAHLEIQVDGIHQTKAREAWERIRRLKEALALDPQHAGMLSSIGDILLTELEQPREAESYFRDALAIEPMHKERQQKLMEAIRARSLLYRTLSLPISAAATARNWSRQLHVISLLFIIKGIALFLAWLIAAWLLLTPAARVYEWLVLTEATRGRELPRWLSPLGCARGWPLWLRLLLAFCVIVGAWLLIFSKGFGMPPETALQTIGLAFALHFVGVSLFVGLRKLRARFGLWRDRRRQKREQISLARGAAGASFSPTVD